MPAGRPGRRHEIATALRPAFVGGARPSLEAATRAAGISRATFYRHFRSRAELLGEFELEPDPAARQRVLETALVLVGRLGLPALSMDELAARAGVSRATVYRLFPGKPALFRELVRAFSPWEAVQATVARMHARPPEEVMPALARAIASSLEGRLGVVGSLLPQVMAGEPDTDAAVDFVFSGGLHAVIAYVAGQMSAGRLRPMHPILAIQGFAGPIIVHLLTRPLAQRRLGLDMSLDDAVGELAFMWVRGMRPDGGNQGNQRG